jgi:hypothetical protein
MGLFRDLTPLLTCGALVLLALYLFAYQMGQSEYATKPPCAVTYEVAEPDAEEYEDLDALMNKRDPFLHYVGTSNHIKRHAPPLWTGGPTKHPVLEDVHQMLPELYRTM